MEAGFNRAWNSILDSNVSSLITATILYVFGSPTIRGFALVLIIGILDLDVHRDHRHPDDPARGRPPRVGPQGAPVGRDARRSSTGARGPAGPAGRRARVLDIIGKRNWFFLFSRR